MRAFKGREPAAKAARAAAVTLSVTIGTLFAPTATETAVANGDTRTIHFYHTHTGESIDATFRVDGHYDQNVLRQLNHFLRDWRNNDETTMDPRLFDTLWEVYRTAGATQPIQIYSAYRSPETNAMLRRRSRAVAEHSQHMLGKAMDTTIPGFPMHLIREVGMKLQRGGVGWYPSANFVHLDVGGVRSWPRMSYDQLASLFPDGKTVHIASNGQVLPGYEAARQEIAARGAEAPPSQESGGFFAWLFGGWGSGSGQAHEDEEDRRTTAVAAAQPAPAPVAAAPAPAPQPAPETVLAYAGNDGNEVSSRRTAVEPEQLGTEPKAASAARQVASLESDVGEPMSLGGAAPVMPLPPRRPSELLRAAEPIIPLPPMRPVALAKLEARPSLPLRPNGVAVSSSRNGLDAIGSLITKTGSGLPALRRSRLPSVLSQGSRSPGQALAFAPPDVVARDEVPVLRRPLAAATRPLGLRTGLRAYGATAATNSEGATPAMPAGPRLTGLRALARARLNETPL